MHFDGFMKRRVIILADPPLPPGDVTGRAYPNLGILYIIAALRHEVQDLDIHYVDSHISFDDHLRLVEQIQPWIYGLSFASPYAQLCFRLIDHIKKKRPSTIVVCGGTHPTAKPLEVMASTRADACCLGEGEQTFVNFVQAVLNGTDLCSVAGIVKRTTENVTIKTASRPLVNNLDELPLPAWDLVDFKNYRGCSKRKSAGSSTSIVASRGCPYECVFCSNPVWRFQSPRVRKRSPHNIAKEVALLYHAGIREIYIRSDEMNFDVDWSVAVFHALAELGRPDLYFQCLMRPSPMTHTLANSMAKAGCWLCHVGIESGSQRVLDGIRKRVTLEQIEESCKILREHGIKVFGFMMSYQAWEAEGMLQVETTKEVLDSLRFVLNLKRRGLIDYIGWGFATPYPGSELYEVCNRYHLLRPSKGKNGFLSPQAITTALPGIPKREMVFTRVIWTIVKLCFYAFSRESWSARTISSNLRLALENIRQMMSSR